MDAKDEALLALGRELQVGNYRFTTITPTSHDRVNKRQSSTAPSPLTRVFGWSWPFHRAELPSQIVALLEQADELETDGELLRATVRFSTLGDQLFVHSAFPTDEPDAVFFGPDTYRFARVLRQAVADMQGASLTVIDIGCGSGAGGLHAAGHIRAGGRVDVILSDVNRKALRYSGINARLNGVVNVRTVLSDVFGGINEGGDLIISNPPYLVDHSARLYRHGGGELGFDLSLRIVNDGVDRLYPGGRLLLYTGTPIIDGCDQFLEVLRPRLEARGCQYSYEEIDPDVFGEELDSAPYDRVDRIAVIALTVQA